MRGYVEGMLVAWWMYRIVHVAALCFVKLSILYFFKTIASHRTLRHIVNGTIVFVILYTLGSVIAAIFQCRNVADAWSADAYFAQFNSVPDPNAPVVVCYDPTYLYLATAALNLFSDAVILLIPIPTLLGLNVPLKQRLGLVAIFSVGTLATAASAARMHVMRMWAESPYNSAIYGSPLLLWGMVEINAGIISASVPFLRLLFKKKERQERRGYTRKVVEIQSPRSPWLGRKPEIEPLEMDTIVLFPKGTNEHKEDEEKGWRPFITVPASLGDRSCSWSSVSKPQSPRTMS